MKTLLRWLCGLLGAYVGQLVAGWLYTALLG
jgi:hypothetical protein